MDAEEIGSSQKVSGSSVTEVATIGAIDDPVIRNLRITQCYHELSAAIAERASPGANWCTFATWPSRQAGQTIAWSRYVAGFAAVVASGVNAPDGPMARWT